MSLCAVLKTPLVGSLHTAQRLDLSEWAMAHPSQK